MKLREEIDRCLCIQKWFLRDEHVVHLMSVIGSDGQAKIQ